MKKLLIALVGMMTVLPGCDWCCWRKKKCCKTEERCEKPMKKKCCRKETHMRHHDHDME